MQVLFQMDIGKMNINAALENIQQHTILNESDFAFTNQLVNGTEEKKPELDQTISTHCHDWQVERMSAVDRNILRLALYEILYLTKIPNNVSINEAVEMAKRFGTDESSRFVNGILGAIARSL